MSEGTEVKATWRCRRRFFDHFFLPSLNCQLWDLAWSHPPGGTKVTGPSTLEGDWPERNVESGPPIPPPYRSAVVCSQQGSWRTVARAVLLATSSFACCPLVWRHAGHGPFLAIPSLPGEIAAGGWQPESSAFYCERRPRLKEGPAVGPTPTRATMYVRSPRPWPSHPDQDSSEGSTLLPLQGGGDQGPWIGPVRPHPLPRGGESCPKFVFPVRGGNDCNLPLFFRPSFPHRDLQHAPGNPRYPSNPCCRSNSLLLKRTRIVSVCWSSFTSMTESVLRSSPFFLPHSPCVQVVSGPRQLGGSVENRTGQRQNHSPTPALSKPVLVRGRRVVFFVRSCFKVGVAYRWMSGESP